MGVIWIDSRRFAAAGATDPDFANVSLLLHMDGSNGSTAFTDSSSNAFSVTANGNAQISTAQSKFGGASAYFDGTGDYLTVASDAAFGFGTGDFTIEYFVRPDDALGVAVHIDFQLAPAIYSIDSNLIYYAAGDNRIGGTGVLSATTWHHIAAARSGTSTRLFVDGTQVGSTWTDTTNYGASNSVSIGASYDTTFPFDGYIDELRITKGVARYTANFTPPTAPFPDS